MIFFIPLGFALMFLGVQLQMAGMSRGNVPLSMLGSLCVFGGIMMAALLGTRR